MIGMCKDGVDSDTSLAMIRRAALAAVIALTCGIAPAHAAGVLNIGLVPSEDPRMVVNDNQALLDHLHNSL